MDLYREEILEHWKHPSNFGEMKKPDVVIEQVNPICGDEVTFYFRFQKSQKVQKGQRSKSHERLTINDVRFTGSGCAISVASASLLSEAIKGKKVSELAKITGKDVLELIGGKVAPARLKCAFLSLEAVRKLSENNV